MVVMFLEGSRSDLGKEIRNDVSASDKRNQGPTRRSDLVLNPNRLKDVDEELVLGMYKQDTKNGDTYWSPNTAAAQNVGFYNPVFTTEGLTRETSSEVKDTTVFSSKVIKGHLEEISIPGFKTIFGKRAKLPRKSMWTFILIVCLLTSGFQVQDRIFYYLSSPVAVSVRVTRNDTLRFPIISICNKNGFNVTHLMELRHRMHKETNSTPSVGVPGVDWSISELVGFDGMNGKDVWDAGSHDPDKMLIECWFGRNTRCSDRGRWKKVYTYLGVCYSYHLYDPAVRLSGVFNNLYLKLDETEKIVYNQDDGWKLLVHDERDSPLIDVRTHGSTIYRGWGKDLRIYVRSFKTLNTKQRPCEEDRDYSWSKCIADCFVQTVASMSPCLLPYMEGVPGNYCNTPESYNQSMRIADDLLFYGRWSSSNCTCPRQCSEDIFLPYTETSVIESGKGKLRVFFQDLTFDDIRESIGYTAIPLLCDIGGAMGLLLGASMLTIFEILEAISVAFLVSGKSVKKKMSRRRQSRNKEQSAL